MASLTTLMRSDGAALLTSIRAKGTIASIDFRCVGLPPFEDRPPALGLGGKTLLKIAGVRESVELRFELGPGRRLPRVHGAVGRAQRRLDAERTASGDLAGKLDRPLQCCIGAGQHVLHSADSRPS